MQFLFAYPGTNFTNSLYIKESERINIIYNYIKENHLQQISLQDIAYQLSMSSDTFSRFFKKTFNKSVFAFLNEYIVNIATKMLIDTDYSISEVGYKIGYNNLTFFFSNFINILICHLQNTEMHTKGFRNKKSNP